MSAAAPTSTDYLRRLPDGTVKQVNPFTGTEVWTVPGRGHRPLQLAPDQVSNVDPDAPEAHCAFCRTRLTETTPEKSRLVRPSADANGNGAGDWRVLDAVPADELFDTTAEFRVFGNLFEIVSLDFWKANHDYSMSARARRHQDDYLSTEAGREHVRALVRTRLAASGQDPSRADSADGVTLAELSESFFGGCHDVVVARRHHTDGALRSDASASSGTLTPEEHARFVEFTIRAAERLTSDNPFAAYVSVFQNWLKPAGASFDHLHKQLVCIDEIPSKIGRELTALRADPDLYNRLGVDHAAEHGLVVAENEHAVAVAGTGHRYPALEVFSTSAHNLPWEHTPEEIRGVSDLLHACHAATGARVPCNEEWHYRPPGADLAMPWRIVLKWRISNPAGFEGATGIYVNTIDPWTLRDRILPRLTELRAEGAIAPCRIGGEAAEPDAGVTRRLRYAGGR